MRIARKLLGRVRDAGFDYHCFAIMCADLAAGQARDVHLPAGVTFRTADPALVAADEDASIRDTAWCGGDNALGFALLRNDRIVSLQWIWFGPRLKDAAFWSFEPDAAASVQLITVPPARGQGLATALKQLSAARIRAMGFSKLYSRIWWTHTSSLRVSEKAGWKRVGTTYSVTVPWRKAPLEWRRVLTRRASRPVSAPGGVAAPPAGYADLRAHSRNPCHPPVK
jgi:RimJ/RimL family protein N-acetyltransferase